MIVSLRGRTVSVSPHKLLTAFAVVLTGLFLSFVALTQEGGPAEFFRMEALADATHDLAVSVGFAEATDETIAATTPEVRAPREFMSGTWAKDGGNGSFWGGGWFNVLRNILMIVFALAATAVALLTARKFHREVKAREPGNPKMVEIAEAVREGAFAYLARQRSVVLKVLVATAVLIGLLNLLGMHWFLCIFIVFGLATGGLCSFATGWFGMNTATIANCRTAWACTKADGLNEGLQVAFRAGAVMGLAVVGVGLGFVTIWLFIMGGVIDPLFEKITLNEIANAMINFGLGASLVALFARVGGGIYTKAADVGADLVGKVEAGIPEDDPRNPATIADNVGDNVGDVAGMGADLYESYVGSILACIALAWSAGLALDRNPWAFVAAPILIAAGGILLSLVGTKFVKTKEGATLAELLAALQKGVNVASIGTVPIVLVVCILCFGWMFWGMFLATCIGLGAGIVIAWACGRYTGYDFKPTQSVALNAQTGPATVIISGLAVGMMSTWIPILTVCVATLLAFGFGGGFVAFGPGVYAVSLAAVGMLCTLGITLATDAYGPIADNAGGNAEMSGLPPEVREKTDALDALGNTTAAIGKGFAIGSAALTALGLIAAYSDSLGSIAKHMEKPLGIEFSQSMMILSPSVIIGLFIGGLLVFIFCALTMKAVGDAAKDMVEEVRRQFREIPGLREGKEGVKPEHAKCVDISTQAALRKMMLPALIAVLGPIATGVFFGAGAVFGLLAGGLAVGFAMGVMMANAGGSWDNAKKYIEKGGLAELLIAQGKYNPEVEDAALAPVKGSQGGPDGKESGKSKKGKKSGSGKTKSTRKSGKSEGDESADEAESEDDSESDEKAGEFSATGETVYEEPGSSPAVSPTTSMAELSAPSPKIPEATAPAAEPAPVVSTTSPAPAPDHEVKKKYKRYMKGSPEHKAAVVGDTVGDPFKDTSGPSLNILVKLMSMVAVATVALTMAINDGNGILPWIFELIFTSGK
jgi:K(+)-stimulated pyrophosphate-energized sodium pump